MGWLPLVGSLKLQVSLAEYHLFYRSLLQKRPIKEPTNRSHPITGIRRSKGRRLVIGSVGALLSLSLLKRYEKMCCKKSEGYSKICWENVCERERERVCVCV